MADTAGDRMGRIEGNAYVMPLRVYYGDTDAGGVVYHARYLDMAERCRTEFLRALNWPLVGADGEAFVVRRAELDWHRPALLDDLLICRTTVEGLGASAVQMAQRFERDGTHLATALIKLAYVSGARRPIRLPVPLRAAFAGVVAGRHCPEGGVATGALKP